MGDERGRFLCDLYKLLGVPAESTIHPQRVLAPREWARVLRVPRHRERSAARVAHPWGHVAV